MNTGIKALLALLTCLLFLPALAQAVPNYAGVWKGPIKLVSNECGFSQEESALLKMRVKQVGDLVSFRRKFDGILTIGKAKAQSFTMAISLTFTIDDRSNTKSFEYRFKNIKDGSANFRFRAFERYTDGVECEVIYRGRMKRTQK